MAVDPEVSRQHLREELALVKELAATNRWGIIPDYGRLTVLVQWLMDVKPLFEIPAAAFTPAPKVSSTVVRLIPRPAPLFGCERTALERVTRSAFGQRRKMLRQSLKTLHPRPGALLAQAGLPETLRAEEVDIAGFCALARALVDERQAPG